MKKRILSIVLSLALMLTTVCAGTSFASADAGTSLPSGIYMKQMGSGYCTLASACMMMRSKAYLEGNKSWPNLTQQAIRSTAWAPGLYYSFTYYGISVGHAKFAADSSGTKKGTLINLLKSHPEGIEIYCRGSNQHAVFLTRYASSSDTFYVCDPVYGYEQPLTSSWLRKQASTQTGIINAIDDIWYISGYTAKTIPGGLVGEVPASTAVTTPADTTVTTPVDSGTTTAPVEDELSGSLPLPSDNTYEDGTFVDVLMDVWYVPSVKKAYEMNLVKGTSTTTFSPSGNLTLAQSITLAARIHSIYYYGSETPIDSYAKTDGRWFTKYVEYAYDKGIIGIKYHNSSVNYDTEALRVQFAEILAAALPDRDLGTLNEVPDGSIADLELDPSDARSIAVYKLYRAGVLTGDSAGFRPWSKITRAEVSAVVSRMGDIDLRMVRDASGNLMTVSALSEAGGLRTETIITEVTEVTETTTTTTVEEIAPVTENTVTEDSVVDYEYQGVSDDSDAEDSGITVDDESGLQGIVDDLAA